MELVGDRTVGEELRREGPFPPDRAERVIRQAASGLAAAHRQGIVHRDIKPGNLLLARDGSVKVADFGIVRFLDDASTTMTSAGQIVGTSHFLAPERALGKPAEPPSDVYALGCVLYQVLTGRPPFMADDPASIMFQHVERARRSRRANSGRTWPGISRLWCCGCLRRTRRVVPLRRRLPRASNRRSSSPAKRTRPAFFRYAGRRRGRCLPGQLRRSLCWRRLSSESPCRQGMWKCRQRTTCRRASSSRRRR